MSDLNVPRRIFHEVKEGETLRFGPDVVAHDDCGMAAGMFSPAVRQVGCSPPSAANARRTLHEFVSALRRRIGPLASIVDPLTDALRELLDLADGGDLDEPERNEFHLSRECPCCWQTDIHRIIENALGGTR